MSESPAPGGAPPISGGASPSSISGGPPALISGPELSIAVSSVPEDESACVSVLTVVASTMVSSDIIVGCAVVGVVVEQPTIIDIAITNAIMTIQNTLLRTMFLASSVLSDFFRLTAVLSTVQPDCNHIV
jgi:hypothetical protein